MKLDSDKVFEDLGEKHKKMKYSLVVADFGETIESKDAKIGSSGKNEI